MAVKKRRSYEREKTSGVPACTQIDEEKVHPSGPASRHLILTLNVTPVVKGRTIDLKEFNVKSATMEIIRRDIMCRESSQLSRGTFKKPGQEISLTTQSKQRRRRETFEVNTDSNFEDDVWGSYWPPVEGHPILIDNNRMQVSRRSLPYVHVAIKCKSVPAVIDPSVSVSFICNDLYNIYVQSHYSEEEICYSEGRRKKEIAYCWWSQRRAVITRAHITLPIKWDTTAGGFEDVVQLNLIQPNPGFINGFIVLGKDFYTKYVPSFCLPRNLIAINPPRTNMTAEMKMCWSSVTDFIPIADQRKGVVYFIDKYEKNRKYCKLHCRRRLQPGIEK